MPNNFAYLALFSWPLVVFFLFRRLPRAEALIWSIFAGYLLLPFGVGIKVKMIPAFDKGLIPSLTAALLCLVTPAEHRPLRTAAPQSIRQPAPPPTLGSAARARPHWAARSAAVPESAYTRQQGPAREEPGAAATVPQRRRGGWLINLLLVLLVCTPFVTVLQNGEPMKSGPLVLPGLRLYDAFSMISAAMVSVLPFLLGRRYLARPEYQELLLRIFCISALFYSLPTLFEIRMSPQLSLRVYGFLSQKFLQAMRDGAYRPVVFLQQGLWLAIFMAMAALAGTALWRVERARGRQTRWLLAGAYLGVVLALSHSLGALLVFVVLGVVAFLATTRQQMVVATLVAAIFLTYPMLRGANLVPVEAIYQMTKSWISAERADSFYFRVQNEDQLLAHANQKPLTGWGSWGRDRVYDSNGNDISTTDGIWIIVIGTTGWLGYIATFGLLSAPILLLTLRRQQLNLSLATSGLCLVLAANLTDMIPNATLTPVTWLIAGALAGRYGFGPAAEPEVATLPRRRVSAPADTRRLSGT